MGLIGLRLSLLRLPTTGLSRARSPAFALSSAHLTVNQLRLASSKPPKNPATNGKLPKKPQAPPRNASASLQNNPKIARSDQNTKPNNDRNGKQSKATPTSSAVDRSLGFSPASASASASSTASTERSPLGSDDSSRSEPLPKDKVPTGTPSSTLASQMLELASDFQPPPPPNERTGAKSRLTGKRPLSSTDKRRQLLGRILGSMIVGLAGLWGWNQGREWDSEGERRLLGGGEDGDRLSRLRARLFDLFDYFNKPAWNPLLPAPLPEPHGRRYTLLVDLDDLLIHSGWDREHGWRTAKRPGVDYFLSYLSQLYEIVIFTTQPAYTAAPICEKLDPFGYYAPYKLFKESCRTKGILKPQLIKDLDYLGRDLRKVVYVETEPSLVQMHPDNGFIVPKWKGDPEDSGLVDLIPLLEAIVFNGVNDVRDVARAYRGRDPVKAYAESESRQKKELVTKWEAERAKNQSRWYIDLRSLFGLGGPKTDEPPKLPVEKDRARAQQAYLDEQKYWKENEATFKKLMEEDRARQMAEMKGSLLSFLSGQMGPPQPGQQPSSDTSTALTTPTSSASSKS